MRSRSIFGGALLLCAGFGAGWLSSGSRSPTPPPEPAARVEPIATEGGERLGSLSARPAPRDDSSLHAQHQRNDADTEAKSAGPIVAPVIRGRLVDAQTGVELDPGALTSPLGASWQEVRWGSSRDRMLSITIHPKPGWIAWEETDSFATPFPGAQALAFVYPLYRAVPATLTVVDAAGRPLPGAVIRKAKVGAKSVFTDPLRAAAETDEHGAYRFSGIPFVPGADVTIDVHYFRVLGDEEDVKEESPDHVQVSQAHGMLVTRFPVAIPSDLSWTLRLPPETRGPNPEAAEEAGSRLIDIGGGDGRELPKATIRVRALLHDGRVAAGASVQFNGTTVLADADGRAVFTWTSDRDTDLTLALVDPVLVPLARRVHVRPGATEDIELREPEAGQLQVTVLDPDGQPARFARLIVTTAAGVGPWDLQGSTLRVDPFTDEHGVRRYSRVGPGGVTVEASWLGNEGKEPTTIEEGKESRVVVRLARAKDGR